MANSIVISRIQHRRGRRENLPQPLRVGEIALTSDTGQVWIGGDPTLAAPGVKVFADKTVSVAQNIADTMIVESKFTGDFTTAGFTSLRTALLGSGLISLNSPEGSIEEIYWDDTFRGTIVSLTINDGGTGYATGDAITATSPTGSGFVGTITETGGVVDGVVITNGGSGYRYDNTTFTVTSGGGNAVDLSTVSMDVHGYSVFIAADTTNHPANTIANITSEVAGSVIGGAVGISSAALGGSFGGLFGAGFRSTFDHVAAAQISTLINNLNGTLTPADSTGLVYTNLNIEIGTGAGGGVGSAIPYEAAFYLQGVVTEANWVYSIFIFTSDITFRSTATSYAYAATAPAGGTTFDLQKNDVSFGNISFSGAATVGAVSIGSDTSFTAGDRLSIVGPASPDGTIDQVAITLLGELTL